MGLKVGCVYILWLGLEIETPKSNAGIWNHTHVVPIINFIN
jgi:hypothetical protein